MVSENRLIGSAYAPFLSCGRLWRKRKLRRMSVSRLTIRPMRRAALSFAFLPDNGLDNQPVPQYLHGQQSGAGIVKHCLAFCSAGFIAEAVACARLPPEIGPQ